MNFLKRLLQSWCDFLNLLGLIFYLYFVFYFAHVFVFSQYFWASVLKLILRIYNVTHFSTALVLTYACPFVLWKSILIFRLEDAYLLLLVICTWSAALWAQYSSRQSCIATLRAKFGNVAIYRLLLVIVVNYFGLVNVGALTRSRWFVIDSFGNL